MQIISGAAVAEKVLEECRREIAELAALGRKPGLGRRPWLGRRPGQECRALPEPRSDPRPELRVLLKLEHTQWFLYRPNVNRRTTTAAPGVLVSPLYTTFRARASFSSWPPGARARVVAPLRACACAAGSPPPQSVRPWEVRPPPSGPLRTETKVLGPAFPTLATHMRRGRAGRTRLCRHHCPGSAGAGSRAGGGGWHGSLGTASGVASGVGSPRRRHACHRAYARMCSVLQRLVRGRQGTVNEVGHEPRLGHPLPQSLLAIGTQPAPWMSDSGCLPKQKDTRRTRPMTEGVSM